MFESKIASLVSASLLICYYLIFQRMVPRFRYHPAFLFALFWGLVILVPEVLLINYKTSFLSILFVVGCCLMTTIPAIVRLGVSKSPRYSQRFVVDACRLKRACISIAILSMVTTVGVLVQNGFDIHSILFNFMTTSGNYAAIRGNVGIDYGMVGAINISSTYAVAALAGILTQISPSRKRYVLAIGLLPALFLMILQSQKLVFLISLGFFLGGYLSILALDGAVFRWRKIISVFSKALVVVIVLLLVSMVTRDHFHNVLIGESLFFEYLVRDFANYFLAEIFSFSDFFNYYTFGRGLVHYSTTSVYPGQYTLFSVYNLIGFGDGVLPAFYDEIYTLEGLTDSVQFTIFRGTIHDFGVIGSLFFFLFVGFIFDANYSGVLGGKRQVFHVAFYVSSIAFIVFSYVLSLFMALFPFLVFSIVFLTLLTTRNRKVEVSRGG